MPSLTEIKARAVKAKDASVEKYQNTRDRHISVPLKKTNWDPYSGPPPPPPPPRVNSGSRPQQMSFPPPPSASSRSTPTSTVSNPPGRALSLPRSQDPSPALTPPMPPSLPTRKPSTGPPPIERSTRPGFSTKASFPPSQQFSEEPVAPELDWCNLSLDDKHVFFSWLDEYFSRSLNIVSTPPL